MHFGQLIIFTGLFNTAPATSSCHCEMINVEQHLLGLGVDAVVRFVGDSLITDETIVVSE
jgi:hypothetical protein